MAIVGGGFVACEFAHVFSALGVEVTQIQRSSRLLRVEEAEISRRYTELARGRHDLRLETVVSSATRSDGGTWTLGLKGLDGDTDLEVDAVLVAVGRTPNGARLEVEAGGIELDERGVVVVDEQQRTTADGVWALGDVANSWQLKHVANHEARIVAHNLAVDTGRHPTRPRSPRTPTTASSRTPSSATRRSPPSARPAPSSTRPGRPT